MNNFRDNNKRLARNTLMLYTRMLIIMVLSFFSTRILLHSLGEIDFGLCNVVGSVVALFTFVSGPLSGASARFFSCELVNENGSELKKLFFSTCLLYVLVVLMVIILSETVGIWVIQNKLIIPENRISAVQTFFQITLIVVCMNLFIIPFSALIIAHEAMEILAMLNIFEVLAKLLGIILLATVMEDRVIYYGCLLLGIASLNLLLYVTICWKKYPECRLPGTISKTWLIKIFTFSIWQFWGAVSVVVNNALTNVLLNNYFGAIINTARGISVQVNSSMGSFTQNFMLASRPQIIKYWSLKDEEHFFSLVKMSSKLGFYLLWFVGFPVLLNVEILLKIWLSDVPEFTVAFTRWTIMATLMESFSYPLMSAAMATGRNALYQTVVGGGLILNFPISWLCLVYGLGPLSVVLVSLVMNFILLWVRLIILKKIACMKIIPFVKQVLRPASIVVLASTPIPLAARLLLGEGFCSFIASSILAVINMISVIYFYGLNASEKMQLILVLRNYLPVKVLQR